MNCTVRRYPLGDIMSTTAYQIVQARLFAIAENDRLAVLTLLLNIGARKGPFSTIAFCSALCLAVVDWVDFFPIIRCP